MSKETGGPAFPDHEGQYDYTGGMTLRDYFAAKALSGWLASYPGDSGHPVRSGNSDDVAKYSYMMADAMLKARGE